MATGKALHLPARNLHQCVLSPSEWVGQKKRCFFLIFPLLSSKKPKPNANCAACAMSSVQTCVKVGLGFPCSRDFIQCPGQRWPCVSLSFPGFISNMTIQRQFFPNDEDQTGAAKALLRLQDTYNLDTDTLSRGNLPGESHPCLLVPFPECPDYKSCALFHLV